MPQRALILASPPPGGDRSAATRGHEKPDFEALYREQAPNVERWVRRFAGPSADVSDLVHDVFLVVMRSLDRYDPARAALSTWLFGIVVRTLQARRRRSRLRRRLFLLFRSTEHASEGMHAVAATPDARLEAEERRRMLYEVLDRLGERYRTALILADIEGLPAAEIAEITGTSVRNVHLRVFRARRMLTVQLADRIEAMQREGNDHG